MNKLLLSLLLLIFICCKNSFQNEINVLNLQESFIAKNEIKFLNQFPKDFNQFHNYFGWDAANNEPEKLYESCNDYINYWFDLLSNEKYKEYENNIIGICANGKWEADGINYFQDKSINYIKEKQKFYLINDLKDDEAKSVLFFLFDSPHPKFDITFASNLSPAKQHILNELFETAFSDKEKDLVKTDNISFYRGNDAYFIKDIDINNDAIPDKVVSSKRYQGNELLLFIKNNDTYELALKTSNFSEDGGNQIVDIKAEKNGFLISTAFPDRGLYEAHYHVSFIDDTWMLTHTIYKTVSGNQQDSFIYVCDVQQGINMNDVNLLKNLKQMPDESDRDKTCLKQKKSYSSNLKIQNKRATIDSVSISQMKFYINEELPTIFDYYKQEKIEDYSAWSDKLFGRCCSNTDLTFNENLFLKISANYSDVQYPIRNIEDNQYTSAFVFKPNSGVKIDIQMNLDQSYYQGKNSNKNILKPDEVIMKPIKLSIINGYVKSKKLFYENARVKQVQVYVNNIYKETVTLLDTPLVQEFEVNAVFKTNDTITLEPRTYYKGSKYDDICISEIQTNLGETAVRSLNKKFNLQKLMNQN